MSNILRKEFIINTSITNAKATVILDYLTTGLHNNKEKYFIVTPNPEIVVYAYHHPQFSAIINQAQIALPDGAGLTWAARFLGEPLEERIAGVDFMDSLCEKFSKGTGTIGLLGGRNKVAETAAECLLKKFPGLHIIYVGEEWDKKDFYAQLAKHDAIRLDVLFVALGFPKQEEWMAKNLDSLPVGAAMGVGGAFDYLSGRVGRAPKQVRDLGFEWFWRLVRQPWRIRRQLRLVEFIYLVLKEKISDR